MGGSKKYLESGGFTERTYETVDIVNGIKIVRRKDGSNNTPPFSNTPYTIYAKIEKDGEVNQVAVYGGKDGREKIKDIDIGHKHTNWKNGKKVKFFSKKDIHVQEYIGTDRNSNWARKPSRKERRLFMLARYGRK